MISGILRQGNAISPQEESVAMFAPLRCARAIAKQSPRLVSKLAKNVPIAAHKRLFFSKIASFFGGGSTAQEDSDKAHGDMIDAVRELSGGQQGLPMSSGGASQDRSSISGDVLRELDGHDLGSLSVEQLLALARAHYDGNFGDGGEVRVNKARAVSIWKLLSVKDPSNSEAKYCLSSSLRTGDGATRDAAAAFLLMNELANKHDYYLAHYDLAVMYAANEGVAPSARNDFEALKHFRRAAKEGIRPALYNIANFLSAGRGVENKNQEHVAAKYYQEAAEAGDPAAMFTLGAWYVQGRGGLTKNNKKAFDLQCRAGQAGHPGAMYNAACHLMAGQGCAVDVPLAAEWFQRCVDVANLPEACVNLGNLYRDGHPGLPVDLEKAKSLYARHSMTHEGCRTNLFMLNQMIEDAK